MEMEHTENVYPPKVKMVILQNPKPPQKLDITFSDNVQDNNRLYHAEIALDTISKLINSCCYGHLLIMILITNADNAGPGLPDPFSDASFTVLRQSADNSKHACKMRLT